MATESITELASIIATSTAQVSAYLDQNGLPQPSFAVTGPSTSQIPPSEVEIESARLTAIDATQRLRNLLLGPHDFLTSITVVACTPPSHTPIVDKPSSPVNGSASKLSLVSGLRPAFPLTAARPLPPSRRHVASRNPRLDDCCAMPSSGTSFARPARTELPTMLYPAYSPRSRL